jgi:hypothetical protein
MRVTERLGDQISFRIQLRCGPAGGRVIFDYRGYPTCPDRNGPDTGTAPQPSPTDQQIGRRDGAQAGPVRSY